MAIKGNNKHSKLIIHFKKKSIKSFYYHICFVNEFFFACYKTEHYMIHISGLMVWKFASA